MSDGLEQAARRLRDAADTSRPGAPVRDLVPDLAAAYVVQATNNGLAIEAGRQISGYKVGLTAEPAQAFFGTDEPMLGVLFEDMCVADGETVAAERLLQPRLEGEVAVVIGADLDRGGYEGADVAGSVDHVLPAIEIVDCRIAEYDLTLVDMVSDNAGGGLYVLGSTPVLLGDVDLPNVEMSLTVGGEQQSSGTGAACLGNPLNAVAWLANELVARGTPLRAGAHVMTGTLGPMVAMPPDQAVVADFGALGTVSTRWALPA